MGKKLMIKETTSPEWIWLDHNCVIDQYVEFRKEFYLDTLDKKVKLQISADTNFAAYINGQFVGTGQFGDFPENKTFSEIDIADKIITGKNVLAVFVHYCGVDTHSYIPGKARLWYSIKSGNAAIGSDGNCLARLSPSYKQNKQTKISPQMGFVFECDARKDDNWKSLNYICTDEWKASVEIAETPAPVKRPLKQCRLKKKTPFNITAQGVLKRLPEITDKTVADFMQHDFLSARRDFELFESDTLTVNPGNIAGADGFYVIVDMGREECGFVDLELEAGSGTIVDIAVGEHLADLRIRASVGGRNFASRYISIDGKQRFTHFTNRYSGRYMQLHFTNMASDVTIHHIGFLPFEYPLKVKGQFTCPDSLFNKIYDISCRTLHLCIHEHYEDTPWREQALYANDSRNQALTGYYTFGEYDVPRVSFDMLAKTLKDDGYQELCAPMRFDFTIPSFTMVWFLAIRDQLLFSGDIKAAQKQLPMIVRMLDTYFETLVEDLLPAPQGKAYWHFYDWADGLSGKIPVDKENGLSGQRFDAPLNLFFVMALQAAAELLEICNDKINSMRFKRQAELTAHAINENFWVKSENLYQTYIGAQGIDKHFAELTQSLAILANIPDELTVRSLQEKLLQNNNGLVATTLSQSLYKFEAVLLSGETFAEKVFEKINHDWGTMLYSGATSFWETLKGQADFSYAGSLCHGWSAIPAYLFQRYLLGVKPLSPGFKTFQAMPFLSVMDSASGIIPTPYGGIQISWRKTGETYKGEISQPENIELVLTNKKIDWTVRKYKQL